MTEVSASFPRSDFTIRPATAGPLYHTNQQQQPSKLLGSQLYGLDRISSTKSENFKACFEVDSKSNNSHVTVMYYQHLVQLA